ncbi:LOW QUALITY PROTEIN: hypothetical protein TorRG33x02_078570 [Trema orientale]|uniref:Uncharacterized protein n=1 Tax=Trema orientale TaxID=63057 RepID=A0A2P5FEP9_TREOI|nr:LOW QUALITY PROTEIN: hypothetical protein TorRG33x02_078570 [Trema orientale]
MERCSKFISKSYKYLYTSLLGHSMVICKYSACFNLQDNKMQKYTSWKATNQLTSLSCQST